jgi:hypothetical protein
LAVFPRPEVEVPPMVPLFIVKVPLG